MCSTNMKLIELNAAEINLSNARQLFIYHAGQRWAAIRYFIIAYSGFIIGYAGLLTQNISVVSKVILMFIPHIPDRLTNSA